MRAGELWSFDRSRVSKGSVAGVDEAGRGALAGPVVAAAVVLSPEQCRHLVDGGPLAGVDDSKRLDVSRRRVLFEAITRNVLDWSVGRAEVEEIDRVNVLEASLLAMGRALDNLKRSPRVVLVDGRQAPPFPARIETVVGGDGKSLAIACASIIAKVTRDRIMTRLSRAHPGFGWASNKGYATLDHRLALLDRGRTVHHRETFLGRMEVWRQRDLFGR